MNLFCPTFHGNNVLRKELDCIYNRHKLKWNWQTTIKQTAVLGENSNDMASKVMTWYRIVSKSKRLVDIAIRDLMILGWLLIHWHSIIRGQSWQQKFRFHFSHAPADSVWDPWNSNGNNFWRNLEGTRMRFRSAIICNYHSALANSQIPWRWTVWNGTVRYVVTNCKSFGKNLIHRRQRTWTIFSLCKWIRK